MVADALDVHVDRAAEVLRAADGVVVAGHVNPDGDALGSALAITAALRELGIEAIPTWGGRTAGDGPAPLDPALRFLPGTGDVRGPDELPTAPDVLVACDTAAASRLGTLEPLVGSSGTVIVLDHHAVGEPFGDVRIIDPGASCTGVLALLLIDALGVPLTAPIADALYLSLLTDTGRFSFPSTTSADHRVAARLLDAGADHVGVSRAVYESASRGFLALVSRVTGRAVVGDELVASWVTRDDLAATGATDEETDGLIDLLRKVDGPDVACLLRETAQGTWRSSLRSRGATDVSSVAQRFGGGGHRLAAGFTSRGTADEVLATVRSHVGEARS